MIDSEQIAGALERLDPKDREVLYLSLRRRVPDDALAKLYDCPAAGVARLRAAAIERLGEQLEVRRGDDLGVVLTGLLESETWAALEGRGGEVPSARADEAEQGMRAEHGEKAGDGEPAAAPARRTRRSPRRTVAVAAAVGAALALAGFAAAATLIDDKRETPGGEGTSQSRFAPHKAGPLSAPFPSDPKAASCYTTAFVRGRVTLYRSPGGRRKLRLPARTEWDSPRIFGVVRQRGRWLAVQAGELRNGDIGWLPESKARLDCVDWAVHVDLSRRVLVVRRGGRRVKRMRIAVGSRSNPTPKGRFSVTDKLRVADESTPYGCCVLALSGHQTKLPADWPGGDRLAVHATRDVGSIGRRVSLGCMRAKSAQAKWLIEKVPLGAPVFVRS
jgi:L,D-transpeptidase catalytic domain